MCGKEVHCQGVEGALARGLHTGPADAAFPIPLQGSRRKPGPAPLTRRSFSGLNLKSAPGCSVSREPLLGGRAMGLSIARGLPGYRQAVGREVSLRQSSGGARLRSWGVGFHPAPVGVRWRIPQVTFPPRGLTRRGIKGEVNMWWIGGAGWARMSQRSKRGGRGGGGRGGGGTASREGYPYRV
jgi:hypothetical protein